MDIVYTYSHLGREEILLVRHPEIHKEIVETVENIPNPGRNKVSREKTMLGKRLYAPKELNQLFKRGFEELGWQELKKYYDIEIPNYPYKIERAYKQCDFFKAPVLVEVQFGKYAFMFYDLAKFQYFYNIGLIKLGVEIVPCHFLHKQMSTGVSCQGAEKVPPWTFSARKPKSAVFGFLRISWTYRFHEIRRAFHGAGSGCFSTACYGEQLIYDLERLSKKFPSVPVKIILIDMPIESDGYSLGDRELVRDKYKEVQDMMAKWEMRRKE